MKKLIILIFVINTFIVKAQFYTEFNIGYAVPMFDQYTMVGVNKDYKTDEINNIYYKKTSYHKLNYTEGIFSNINIGYKYKEKVILSLGLTYLDNYNIDMLSNNKSIQKFEYSYLGQINDSTFLNNTSNNYTEYLFYSKVLSVNLGISYIFNIKKISIEPQLEYSISKLFLYYTKEIQFVNKINNIIDYETNIIYKYKFKPITTHRVSAGLKLAYKISDRIQVMLTSRYYILSQDFMFLPSTKTRYYFEENNNGNVEIDKNEIEETNTINYLNSKTIDFSIGIRYTFGNKQTDD